MNVRIGCKCPLFFIWQCVFALFLHLHCASMHLWSCICSKRSFHLIFEEMLHLSISVHIWLRKCVETDHIFRLVSTQLSRWRFCRRPARLRWAHSDLQPSTESERCRREPSAPSPPCIDPCPPRRSCRGFSPGSPPRSEANRDFNCILYLLLLHFDRWMRAVSHLVLDFDHADDAGAVFELDPDEGFVQVSVVPHTQLTCVCETRPQLLQLQSHSHHKPINNINKK